MSGADEEETAPRASAPSPEVADAFVRLLFGTAGAGVGWLDAGLRYVRVNETLAGMNGLPPGAHEGRHLREVVPAEAAEALEPLLRRVVETGEPVVDLPLEAAVPGRRPRFFLASYWPVYGAGGTARGVVGVVVERTPAEAALRETEGRIRAVAESGIVGLFDWSIDGGITAANDAFLGLLGYTREDLEAGRVDWRAMTPPEYAALDDAAVAEMLRTGRHPPIAKEYLGRGGRRVPVVVTSAFVAGSRERGVCVCLDDSERRAAETALLEATRAAEAANRAKSEFLAVMSHELRTPLNAIGGYAELLEMEIRGPLTEAQRHDLHRIQLSQRHLLGLINEVLNFARLETGSVAYEITDVALGEALAAAESLVAPQAAARGIWLGVEAPPDGLRARADAEKLRQVLLNLLSNAVKFTEPGGRIDVGCEAEDGRVRIRVRDTGIGIPADRLEAIFDPFVQVRADLTRPHEGTGLGLAISRDLARGMGAALSVESTPGAGSTFTLVLPAAPDGPGARADDPG